MLSIPHIRNYDDFVAALLIAGFSLGGGNSEGIFSLISWDWRQLPPYPTPVSWHTGDRETDPWEWRIRVLDEREDIAYGKLFFNKSGFITRQWAPCFLAARRNGQTLDEQYADGRISRPAKRIYDVICEYGALPVDEIKRFGGFGKEDKAQFDRSLTELQMKMYLTMCGSRRKRSQSGEEYGWNATVLCTNEDFWGQQLVKEAARISPQQAAERIASQARELNPQVAEKKLNKFIFG